MNLFYTIIRGMFYLPFKLFYPTKIINKKAFPKSRRLITVSNHLCWKDVLIVATGFSGYRHVIAKKEIGKNPIIRRLAKWLGIIFVDRGKADMSSMRETVNILKKGEGVTIFPEGTRNKVDTSLQEVKSGVVMFSVKGGAPVVPVMIHHEAKLFRKNYVYVGTPFELDGLKGRRLDTPAVAEGAEIVASRMEAAKDYLDDYVARKRWKEFRALNKEHKRACKAAKKAARRLGKK